MSDQNQSQVQQDSPDKLNPDENQNKEPEEVPFDPNVDYSKQQPYNNDPDDVFSPSQDNLDPTALADADYFLTQQKTEEKYLWKSFDFLFPAGKLAKLVRIRDTNQKMFPYMDIISKIKLDDGYPVVNFIGCKHDFNAKPESLRGKFFAGIARACYNTDSVIVDNAITTGIERYALRRGLKLIGIAPEKAISYPKLNPTSIQDNELSNGHTHMILLNNLEENFQWGDEATFKVTICKKIIRLADGKLSKTQGRPRCKIVNILFADTTTCFDEIREAIIAKQPIIVVKGSKLCDAFIESKQEKKDDKKDQQQEPKKAGLGYEEAEFQDIMNDKDAHLYPLDSLNSEEIAQLLHFLLTYTPYQKLVKEDPKIDK